MTSTRPPESLVSTVMRHGIMGFAGAGVTSAYANGLDDVITQTPTDVTGLGGAQIDTGSIVHHGPSDAGSFLDRPAAGYMAQSSTGSGLEMTTGADGVGHIARDINQAGTFTMDGQAYEVLDYLPGGDVVQIAAGTANPTQIMMTLAQHGLTHEMGREGGGTLQLAPGVEGQTPAQGRAGLPWETGGSAPSSPGGAEAEQGTAGMDATGVAGAGAGAAQAARHAGGHVPDADEDARDREALVTQHRMDLDTAVETSDQSSVHTQIHAHGRTMEIDTQFEARAADNHAERVEAEHHVEQAGHAATDETEHDRGDMHFRSRVHAYLDAQTRDQGMAI